MLTYYLNQLHLLNEDNEIEFKSLSGPLGLDLFFTSKW